MVDEEDKPEDEQQSSSLEKLLICILVGGAIVNFLVFRLTKSKNPLPEAQPAASYSYQLLHTNILISDYVARLKYDARVMSGETNP